MIHGLVRSPCTYFDQTPTGQLTNKFSNDLGVLDNALAFNLVDIFEGPLIMCVLLVNIFSIDLFFLIPGFLSAIFISIAFLFCKQPIVEAKQLDLRLKSPIYSMVNEAVAGLIQIRIFKRRFRLLRDFTVLIDRLSRGTYTYWNSQRAFAVNVAYLSLIVLIIGFIMGIANIENT